MGLIAAYNFNEADTATVHDYSDNLNHLDTVDGTAVIQDGEIAKEGLFGTTWNGVSAVSTALEGLTTLEIAINAYVASSAGTQYIVDNAGLIEIYAAQGGTAINVAFTTSAGTANLSGTLTPDGYEDIHFQWNGTNARLKVNDVTVSNKLLGGTTNAVGARLCLGANYDAGGNTDVLDGRIQTVYAWDKALTGAQRSNIIDGIEGILFNTVGDDHKFEPGDLIVQAPDRDDEAWVVVTQDVSSTQFRGLPISGKKSNWGMVHVRAGHRWDTNRQWSMVIRPNTNEPEIVVLEEVNTPAKYTAAANKVLRITKNGVIRNTNTAAADTTIKDHQTRWVVDSSSSAITMDLPANPINGQEHIITRSGANNVVLDAGLKTINGSSTGTLASDDETWWIYYDGALDNEWKLQ